MSSCRCGLRCSRRRTGLAAGAPGPPLEIAGIPTQAGEDAFGSGRRFRARNRDSSAPINPKKKNPNTMRELLRVCIPEMSFTARAGQIGFGFFVHTVLSLRFAAYSMRIE